jgi:hypothetical protein
LRYRYRGLAGAQEVSRGSQGSPALLAQRRPGRPGEPAAGRKGWTGWDEEGDGPPKRRCPGLCRVFAMPAHAGRVCLCRPRTCKFRLEKARIDICRPVGVISGQKIHMSARGVSESTPAPTISAATCLCRPGPTIAGPGKPSAGP